MVAPHAPASWKQKQASSAPAASGLARRRTMATLALLAALAMAIALIVWKVTQRPQETWLLMASSSAASERLFALPPLRYVQESWEDLDSLRTPWFHIDKVADNFAANDLDERIGKTIGNLRRGDALIVWINGKGICQGNKPVIAGPNFRLPDDPDAPAADESNETNLIEVESLLRAMSQWRGPKLLILDWGQELFDPRINCLGNNFLRALVDTTKGFGPNQPSSSPVWLLVSHLPREISLVDSRERRSIFARAVSEALLGQRRLPTEQVAAEHRAALPPRSEYLTLDNFTDYVHRRVRADTGDYQTPWLLKSGTGVVRVAGSDWSGAERIRLVALDKRHGVPLGVAASSAARAGAPASGRAAPTPDKATADNAASDKPAADKAAAASATGPAAAAQTPASVRALLPKEAEQLGRLWLVIDKWRTPNAELRGWSEAALAPLAFKQIAAKALDFDLRAFSGRFDLSSEIAGFIGDIERNPRGVRPEILASLPADVEPAQRDEYGEAAQSLAAARQTAAVQLELVKLVQCLGLLKTQSLSVDSLQSLVRTLQPGDARSAQVVLDAQLPDAIDRFIEQLHAQDTNRGEAAAMAEVMLQSCALTARQREILRHFQLGLSLNETGDAAWPAKPLVSSPVVDEIAQSQMLQLGDEHLTHVNTGRELIRKLASGAEQVDLPLASLAAADGRDIFVERVLDALWSDIALGKEFPRFPPRPEAPSQWLLRWESAGSQTTSLNEVVRLEGNRNLTLVLTRTGNMPLPFPTITLKPRNVGLIVDGQEHKTDEPVTVEKSWFTGGETLKLAVSVVPSQQREQTSASLEVRADGVKKRVDDLEFELPISEPIQLIAEEQMLRDGVLAWKGTQASRSFFLYPFAGRESQFRFVLKNVDSLAHEVELRVFALPASDREPGIALGQAPRTLPSLQNRVPDLVWKAKIAKGSSEIAALAPYSPTQPVPAQPAAATAAPAAPPAGSEPASATPPKNTNLAGGCALELVVDGDAVKTFSMSVKPKNVAEIIEAQCQLDEAGTLQITAQWVDTNRDGLADLAPADLSKEKPLLIRWDPLPWRIGKDVPITASQIALTTASSRPESMTARGLRIDQSEQEVWLDVDGTPRTLVYTLLRDQVSPVTIPTSRQFRCLWRRYSVVEKGKNGPAYVPYIPPLNDEQEKETLPLLGNESAVFPDLKSPVQIRFAIDLPEPDNRCSVLLGPDHVLSSSPDRLTETDMRVAGGALAVRWLDHDLEVTLESFSAVQTRRDETFPVSLVTDLPFSSTDSNKRKMPSIVVDCEPPTIAPPSLSHEQVMAGSTELVELRIRAMDSSSPITALIMARKIGGVAPMLVAEPTKLDPNRPKAFQLDVSKLEVGDYQLFIELEDKYKHKAAHPVAKRLRVNKPPPVDPANPGGAPQVVGNLRVKAKRPGGGAIYNQVQFKIEPAADGESPIGRDEMVFQQLKPGSYKISASFKERSTTYQGTKTVELKKKEDFNKVVEIEFSKPD